jgi:plastocyanin
MRAGAVALVAVLPVACDAAGDSDEGPRVLELTSDTIQLEPNVRLVQVAVRRDADGEFDPAAAEARQGDVVRFTVEDNAGHAIVFDGATLSAKPGSSWSRSSQLRGPPLIREGAAWIITLDGAPAGEYAFRCTTHDAAGRLTVVAREP